MAKVVTYLGKTLSKSSFSIPGDTFEIGEERLFDDQYANQAGWESGDEYADFVASVWNQNRRDKPLFDVKEASKADIKRLRPDQPEPDQVPEINENTTANVSAPIDVATTLNTPETGKE